jgi:hypothetical protein
VVASARLIRVCVAGSTGWTVAEALDAVTADVLVDFTSASVVKANVLAGLERRVGVVVGSSSLSATDLRGDRRPRAHARRRYIAGTLIAIRALPGRVGVTRGLDQLLHSAFT